jgi:hypothetical protein
MLHQEVVRLMIDDEPWNDAQMLQQLGQIAHAPVGEQGKIQAREETKCWPRRRGHAC